MLVAPNWYNAAFIGLAPLLLAPLTLLSMALAARSGVIGLCCYAYLAACCWAACIPSDADLAIAASYPTSWPIGAALIALIAWCVYKLSAFAALRGFIQSESRI